jgi:hypothetical protein
MVKGGRRERKKQTNIKKEVRRCYEIKNIGFQAVFDSKDSNSHYAIHVFSNVSEKGTMSFRNKF